jgi:hypothetical protein
MEGEDVQIKKKKLFEPWTTAQNDSYSRKTV